MNQAPETYRGVKRAEDPALWLTQNKAVGLLIEIEQTLDEIETLDPDADVSAHREELIDVYKAVYGFDPVWRTPLGNNAGVRAVLVDDKPLRRIASLIRSHRRLAGVGSGDRGALRTALEQALEELGSAHYLRAEVRAYLIVLVRRALDLVADESATDGQVRSVAHEAAGALMAVGETTDVPQAKKSVWKSLAGKVGTAVIVNAATDGVQEGVGQIGQAARVLLGDGG